VFAEAFNQYSESKDASTAPSKSAAFDRLVAVENTAQELKEKMGMKLGNSRSVHNAPQSKKVPGSEKKNTVEKSNWEKELENETKQGELDKLIKLYKRAVDDNESLYSVIKDFELDLTNEERNVPADFFSMKSCFAGGHGYWKYEFCYKKKITQYHVENGKRTHEITLGVWNIEEHDKWFKTNKFRAAIVKREALMQVSNYYSDGDYCDEIKDKRFVETRLKCRIPEPGESLDLVLLYLEEPSPCRYILYLESFLICDALQTLTPQGLVIDPDSTQAEGQYLEEINELRVRREREEFKTKNIVKNQAE